MLIVARGATWRSGYATVCKTVYTSSILVVASTPTRLSSPSGLIRIAARALGARCLSPIRYNGLKHAQPRYSRSGDDGDGSAVVGQSGLELDPAADRGRRRTCSRLSSSCWPTGTAIRRTPLGANTPARDVRKAMQQAEQIGARPAETFVTIQYLRALAAIGIVVFHTMDMTAMRSHFPPAFGEFGVDVFFVISGFVIVTITAQSRRGPLGFWLQRLIRVLPMYWLYTTIVLLALALAPRLFFNERDFDWSYIIKSYLLIPAVNPTIGGITPVFSLGWTLYFEMFFYFFFGLCLLLRGVALRVAALAAVIVVLVAINRVSMPFDPSAYPIFATWTSPQLLEILSGAGIALVASRLMLLPLPAGAALLGLGAILYWIGRDPVHLFNIWTGAGAVAVVAGALVLERAARRHPIRAIVFLGDATFSVYLAHPFAQRIAYLGFVSATGGATAIPFGLAAYVAIMVIAGLAGGLLNYVLLERPLQTRSSKWLGAYRAQRTAQPA